MEIARGGAEINITRPPQEIAGFSELVESIKALVKQNAAKTDVDKAQVQQQLEVLATLQAIINKQPSKVVSNPAPVDITPLQTVLTQIQNAHAQRQPVAYQFDIQKGPAGIVGIRATPVTEIIS